MQAFDPSPFPADHGPDENRRFIQAQLAEAARRWRIEQTLRALGHAMTGLAVIFALWAAAAFFFPAAARGWLVGLGLAAVALLATAGYAWLRAPDWRSIRRRVDQRLGLPDAVLSAAELQDANLRVAPGWAARQSAQTAGSLRAVDWRTAWPLDISHRLGAAGAVALVAALIVGYQFGELRAGERPAPLTAEQQDQIKGMREMFQDWERSEQERPDEELKQLLADLKPFREKLDRNAPMDEREAFKALSRAEDRIAAQQAKLDAQSLKPYAAEMAAAFEKLDGMNGLAAALRTNDFEKAEAQAEKSAQKFQSDKSDKANMPEGAKAVEAANQLGKVGQQMEKNGQAAAKSMGQMQGALQKGDAKQMGAGVQGLQLALANQNAKEGQRRNAALQLKLLGLCKDGMSNCQGICQNMSLLPKLSQSRSQKPGHNAGKGTDLNRAGAETALASDRTKEHLTGEMNEAGESETATTQAQDAPTERLASAGSANFRQYEQLSNQAIADENMPLAHRQTIKRYFEMIRPGQDAKP